MPLSRESHPLLHRAESFRRSPVVLRKGDPEPGGRGAAPGAGRPKDDGKLLKTTWLLTTSLCLSFLTFKMGVLIVPPPAPPA